MFKDLDEKTILKPTHDLIKHDLILFLQEHRREPVEPYEIESFLKTIYKKLDKILED